jgi:hypothetical protein
MQTGLALIAEFRSSRRPGLKDDHKERSFTWVDIEDFLSLPSRYLQRPVCPAALALHGTEKRERAASVEICENQSATGTGSVR